MVFSLKSTGVRIVLLNVFLLCLIQRSMGADGGVVVEDILARLKNMKWIDGANSIRYTTEYLQNGVPAKAINELTRNGSYAVYRVSRQGQGREGVVDEFVANPDYSFHVTRNGTESPWMMEGFEVTTSVGPPQGPLKTIKNEEIAMQFLPYSAPVRKPIAEFFLGFDIQIEQADEGDDIVLVGYKKGGSAKSVFDYIEEFRVYCDKDSLRVNRYSMSGSGGAKVDGEFAYKPSQNSESLLFSWTETHLPPGASEAIVSKIEILQVDHQIPLVESKYFLSAYGFPEPEFASSNSMVWWIVAVAVVLLAIAILVRFYVVRFVSS